MKQPSASIKMLRGHRCKIDSIEHKRWAGYATAALASGFTLCVADSAEAEIHYSGLVNQEVSEFCTYHYRYHTWYCSGGNLTLPLGNNGLIQLSNRKSYYIYGTWWYIVAGTAILWISAPGAAVRSGGSSISRLLPGDLISAGPFGFAGGALASHYGGQFQAPGRGFVGFKFNTGAGDQYGWVRVRMDGAPYNTFGVVDYAYGDPGEVVKAGQKRSHSSADLESLGGLALGAAGLLAWRRRRANQRAAA